MTSPFGTPKLSSDDASIIEFRTLKTSPKSMQNIDLYDQKLLGSFRKMSGYGGMVFIDEATAFDIVDPGNGPNKAHRHHIQSPRDPLHPKSNSGANTGTLHKKNIAPEFKFLNCQQPLQQRHS